MQNYPVIILLSSFKCVIKYNLVVSKRVHQFIRSKSVISIFKVFVREKLNWRCDFIWIDTFEGENSKKKNRLKYTK